MSIALGAKVTSFQNARLGFVEVSAEESTSSGVSPQHAITPVMFMSEQNTSFK